MAVTPVLTGPLPTSSFPSPEISVTVPTSTDPTSVMALLHPGVPGNGRPSSRPRMPALPVMIPSPQSAFNSAPYATQSRRGQGMTTDSFSHYKEFLIVLGVAGLVVPLFLRIGV